MNATVTYRTARIPHLCEGCHWTGSLRGVPTILPGHRYVLHTTFPGAESYEGTRPITHRECLWCFIQRMGEDPITVAACGSYCCGDVPCALPFPHGGEHSCRRCPNDLAEVDL